MIYRTILLALVFLPLPSLLAGTAMIHGPIGVMADHYHKKGEWMISLRISHMEMKKNIFNGNSISANEILNQPNPYSDVKVSMGSPDTTLSMNEVTMPDNLSVVPKNMTMKMVMLGVMYAHSDKVTLMGTATYNDKGMVLDTHKGMMRRDYIGSFNTSLSDISKASFSVLYNLYEENKSRWHIIFGLEKGLGESSEKGLALTPMNMMSEVILPYGMQSSDRSVRLITGITNVASFRNFVIGNQILSKNAVTDKGWRFGDEIHYNLWLQGAFNDNLSYSIRLNYKDQDSIKGSNKLIITPVQASNPKNYGGQVLSIGLGINFITNIFKGKHKDRFSIEAIKPINQKKNGLQMKDGLTIKIGFQKML